MAQLTDLHSAMPWLTTAGLRLGWVTAQPAIIEKLTMTIQVR